MEKVDNLNNSIFRESRKNEIFFVTFQLKECVSKKTPRVTANVFGLSCFRDPPSQENPSFHTRCLYKNCSAFLFGIHKSGASPKSREYPRCLQENPVCSLGLLGKCFRAQNLPGTQTGDVIPGILPWKRHSMNLGCLGIFFFGLYFGKDHTGICSSKCCLVSLLKSQGCVYIYI